MSRSCVTVTLNGFSVLVTSPVQLTKRKRDEGVAVKVASALTQHADFTMKNPNRFRATLGALAGHHAGFHAADGSGYALLADWLIRLDPLNPQTTARMTTMFETWTRYDADRRALAQEALERIAGTDGLSRDTSEMVTRILGSAGA